MKLILVCLLAACGKNSGNPDDSTPKYTYYRDIQPIVERSCVQCHVLGSNGPFPLDNYDAVYTVRELAAEKVSNREMPPWFTSKECANYANDKSLTDEEIAMFEAWVDQGAAEGDPADAPPDGQDTAGEEGRPELESIDSTLSQPDPYYPPSTDEVHCFNMVWPTKKELGWPADKDMFITGVNIRSEALGVMHHMTLHLVEPENTQEYFDQENADPDVGYVCEDLTGVGDTGTEEIGGWTGGATVTLYPEGTGHIVHEGSIVQLQTHYNLTPEEVGVVFDQANLQFSTAQDVVQAYLTVVLDPKMKELDPMIPKGDSDVLVGGDVKASAEIPPKFWVTGAGFHMHYLGIGGGLTIKHKDGTEDCILDLTGWNPDWQQPYDLAEPIIFDHGAGDEWHIECNWDNSQENQPIIGGVQREAVDIVWGTSLDMEMCRTSVHVTGLSEDEQAQN